MSRPNCAVIMDPTAIVIGHSFVKRYAKWIGSRKSHAPASTCDICDTISQLNLLGQSGLFSQDLHSGEFHFQATRHDIVILDCATNDLADGLSVTATANNLLLFARRCIQDGATIVFITSVLPRTRRIQQTPEEFRSLAQQFNQHMKRLCVPERNISFHKITGFTHSSDAVSPQPMEYWSADGIHPSVHRSQQNIKSGMEKYHQAIKTALYRAAQRYQHLSARQ